MEDVQQGAVELLPKCGVDWRKPVPREFDIGMDEYVEATAFQETGSSASRTKLVFQRKLCAGAYRSSFGSSSLHV